MKKLFNTVLPSLLAGGLLFGSALTQADDGRYAPPAPPAPPTAPTAPRAPRAPRPPKAPKAGGPVSVVIHDGHLQINGIDQIASQVDGQIAGAIAQIDSDPNIPPQVRAKLKAKLEKLRGKMAKRISKIDVKDLGQLGEQLEQLGGELGAEMEDFGVEMDEFGKDMDEFGKGMEEWGKQFGKEWEKWGEKMGKDIQRQMEHKLAKGGQWHVQVDDDDDDDMPSGTPDMDPDDMQDAVRDLGQLNLNPQQRAQLKSLRADSDAKVAQAKANLDRASENLKKQLANPSASEADISRSIDAVTQQEAAIRKARILAWVNARRLLDDSQRKKVEGRSR